MASTSLTRKLAAMVLAASFLLPTSTSAAPRHAAPRHCEQVNLLVFHIKAKSERDVYEVGETAVIHVTVTQPAKEDPAAQGIELDPPTSEPAVDAFVGAGLHVGDSFLFGIGITDDEGKADIKIELDERIDRGEVDVDLFAWKDVVRHTCLTVREYGYRRYEDMFRID